MVPASGLKFDVLPTKTKKALERCAALPLFSSPAGWYLAGGTALALQAGHRQSVDLDFFTPQKSFDEKEVEETLSSAGDWKTSSLDRGTIYGELAGAKISLIAYPFFKPRASLIQVGTVSILTPADIAIMKIVAISQRGKRRDFIDLYWISKNVQPLRESVYRVDSQYSVTQNPNHILKSLVYFSDADDDPMPQIFFEATWDQIKNYFSHEVPVIAKLILRLD